MSEKMTTANSAEQGKVDIDFAECAVPKWSRRRFVTMFMIMLGFTFFSASMWVGQEMAAGLDFWGFIKALLLGGAILGIYTGLLGYVGAETGLSLDLLSKRAFGEKGSYISSALTSFTQIGWFGVGIAMFAIPVARELFGGSTAVEWVLILIAGACMTASAYFGIKSLTVISYIAVPLVANGKQGTIATVVAFFIGNSLMFFFGAISYIFVGGNDIFEVMIRLNLFYLAILVLGLNIWTTNDNALYTAGLGLANIFNKRKKPMVLISGVIGTLLSVWLYYNFCGWLNILNCTLPPVGIILVISYFMNKKAYDTDTIKIVTVNWFAVAGVILGAIVANVVTWGIASINGMIVAALCYVVGEMVNKNK